MWVLSGVLAVQRADVLLSLMGENDHLRLFLGSGGIPDF